MNQPHDAVDATTGTTPPRAGASIRRISALARAEGVVLRRSMFALVTAIGAPLLLVMVQLQNARSLDVQDAPMTDGSLVVTSSVGFAMVFSLYCTLLPSLVSRRESLVLKRLRSGELRDYEILVGASVPGLVLVLAQTLCVTVIALAAFSLDAPVNPLLVVVALVLGCVTFIALAAVTAVWTRTVELAQLTAVPLMMASLVCSGLMFPIERLPQALQPIAEVLPLTAVVDLLGLGLAGRNRDGGPVDLATSFASRGPPDGGAACMGGCLAMGSFKMVSLGAATVTVTATSRGPLLARNPRKASVTTLAAARHILHADHVHRRTSTRSGQARPACLARCERRL